MLAWEESGCNLNCSPFDIRHKGGVNLIQAFKRNLGTCRIDDKEERRGLNPEPESTNAMQRGGASRSSKEGSVMDLERRCHPSWLVTHPRQIC